VDTSVFSRGGSAGRPTGVGGGATYGKGWKGSLWDRHIVDFRTVRLTFGDLFQGSGAAREAQSQSHSVAEAARIAEEARIEKLKRRGFSGPNPL